MIELKDRELIADQTKTNSALARAALVALVALAVIGALNFYLTVDEKDLRYHAAWITHIIGIGPERFREVNAMVPTEAVVGYFSDLPNLTGDGAAGFNGARYALAPRLVVPYDSRQMQDWILGNFSKPIDLALIERENSLKLVRDFGSGVMLFRSW